MCPGLHPSHSCSRCPWFPLSPYLSSGSGPWNSWQYTCLEHPGGPVIHWAAMQPAQLDRLAEAGLCQERSFGDGEGSTQPGGVIGRFVFGRVEGGLTTGKHMYQLLKGYLRLEIGSAAYATLPDATRPCKPYAIDWPVFSTGFWRLQELESLQRSMVGNKLWLIGAQLP